MAKTAKQASAKSAGKWLVSTSDLAELFRVNPRSVRRWKDAGCPQEARGKWDLPTVIAWRMDMFTPDEDADPEDLKKREAIAETKWKEARAKRQEIECKALEDKYFAKEDVEDAWAARVAELKASLLNLVKRVPKTAREEVRGEVYDFLDQYSREGKYTPNK